MAKPGPTMGATQHNTITTKQLAAALGVVPRTVRRRAGREGWPWVNGNGRGREVRCYPIATLPAAVQKKIVEAGMVQPEAVTALAPTAALIATQHMDLYKGIANNVPEQSDLWRPTTAVSPRTIRDERVQRLAAIITEALDVPASWTRGKRAWIEAVAVKHGTTFQTIYRNIKRYREAGLAGLQHRKANAGRAKNWSPEALAFWIGLVLKRPHRRVPLQGLYDLLCVEAQKNGWRIGSYRSATWWKNEKVTPQLQALQRGGSRALDNALPPVVRDYSDLAPFEILVGDQHRFDFWVMDDDTGEVFRPEAYLWQDLRTRLIYGMAVARRYDSHLVGLALRIGCRAFAPFRSIYTDNGKPELSRYIMGVMKDMRMLGMRCEREMDFSDTDKSASDEEEINPLQPLPGSHIKAIVKNAKAKMIERTNRSLEDIMRGRFMLPGHCKQLTASAEEQELDHKEIRRLADAGRLPTFQEFTLKMYQAADYYNKEKPHRGVWREWRRRPRPKEITPMQCLERCYLDGWRPRRLSQEAIDLIFLPKAARIVDRGRINFNNEIYEHEALIERHKEKVTLRYDPLEPDWLLVFHRGVFCCRAELAEYSSMKDRALASRKIAEKRRLRKHYTEQYRALTSAVPDFRQYAERPPIEVAAAAVKRAGSSKLKAQKEKAKDLSQERLDAEVATLEAQSSKLKAQTRKVLPERPAVFMRELDRYEWIVSFEMAGGGGTLEEQDVLFKAGYEARMTADEQEYWNAVREHGG